MNASNYNKIAIIGLGYVGLPLALLASRKGYIVVGVDLKEDIVRSINNHVSPFKDNKISEALKSSTLTATTQINHIKDADIVILCVPTPVFKNHQPNLEPIETACASIAPHIKKGQLIILESTVNPGVSENTVLPLLEKFSGLKAGSDFYLAHCPERIDPGNTKWNVENIPRVVGGLDKESLERAVVFYSSVITGTVKPMNSLKEAEAVKIVENSFRDINIAFVNELAQSFSRLGIDTVNVIDGAATKPFAFLAHYPGCGVGGHCIPVDPYYLIEYAKKNGFSHDFLALARRINNHMPEYAVNLAVKALNENMVAINGSRIAILGLAYKADIDDRRESPSYQIIRLLNELGANVIIYDPFVPEESNVDSIDSALHGTHAVIVATDHTVFKTLKPKDLQKHGVSILIDGKNCLSKDVFLQAGITYKGIGR